MSANAPNEPVARVLALVDGEGYSIRGAARIVGVPPDTAIGWVRRARKLTQGNKPILDKWTRRVDQSLDLIQDGLDLIEQDDSRALALKHLQTLNIIAGTGTDKLQKATEAPQQGNLTQVLVILNCDQPQDALNKAKDFIEAKDA